MLNEYDTILFRYKDPIQADKMAHLLVLSLRKRRKVSLRVRRFEALCRLVVPESAVITDSPLDINADPDIEHFLMFAFYITIQMLNKYKEVISHSSGKFESYKNIPVVVLEY